MIMKPITLLLSTIRLNMRGKPLEIRSSKIFKKPFKVKECKRGDKFIEWAICETTTLRPYLRI